MFVLTGMLVRVGMPNTSRSEKRGHIIISAIPLGIYKGYRPYHAEVVRSEWWYGITSMAG